jgi:tRNA modification GTPase
VARRIAPALQKKPPERRARVVSLTDAAGRVFDRGVVTFFPRPRSYTGEDVVEFALHGNPLLVRKLLDAACAAGARPAAPGEFSRRAFLNGKMGLLEAESVGELIDARTEAAARGAMARLSGALEREIAPVLEDLRQSHALWTAAVDFPEQAGAEDRGGIGTCLNRARQALERLVAGIEAGRRATAGLRVAIAGPPNSGKSTIFNALLRRDRAIVSPDPGTTRDTLEEEIEIGATPVRLIDTAGLRDAVEPVEAEGVERARREAGAADLVLFVHDSTLPFSASEEQWWSRFCDSKLLILNKIDLTPREGLPRGLAISAIAEGAGDELYRELARLLEARLAGEDATPIVSLRQASLVGRALEEAGLAAAALENGIPAELAVTHVEEALSAMADLAGETTTEDTLDRIFASYCIGK